MKKYVVKVNVNRAHRFQEKSMQTIGGTIAKNKIEAIEKVYASFWNNTYPDTWVDPSMCGWKKKDMIAEIEK